VSAGSPFIPAAPPAAPALGIGGGDQPDTRLAHLVQPRAQIGLRA
jgi:hypothetical protein